MTLVILLGEIDISIGAQFAVCSVVAGLLAKFGHRDVRRSDRRGTRRRTAGSVEWRSRRTVQNPLHRRHTGHDDGYPRRAPLDYRGRMGAEPPRRDSVGRTRANGRLVVDRSVLARDFLGFCLGSAKSCRRARRLRNRLRARSGTAGRTQPARRGLQRFRDFRSSRRNRRAAQLHPLQRHSKQHRRRPGDESDRRGRGGRRLDFRRTRSRWRARCSASRCSA